MLRNIRPFLFVSILSVALYQVAPELPFSIDWCSYVVALIVGVIAAFIDIRLVNWWSAITRPYEPQEIKLKTKETPAKITGASTKARLYGATFVTFLIALFLFWFDSSITHIQTEYFLVIATVVFIVAFITPMLIARTVVR